MVGDCHDIRDPGLSAARPAGVAARIVKEWPLLVKHGVYTLLSVLTGFALRSRLAYRLHSASC
jgi:hypothetical protein